MATSNAINANSAGLVRYDGAGTFTGVTVTNHAPLIGGASNGITSGTAGTTGQVYMGVTAGDPAFTSTPTFVGNSTFSGSVTFNGGMIQKRTATAISYGVLVTDVIVAVTSTAAARTITMPNSGLVAGQRWTIKDESGACSIFNITIAGNGANVDGSANQVINVNYGSVDIYTDGTNFFLC